MLYVESTMSFKRQNIHFTKYSSGFEVTRNTTYESYIWIVALLISFSLSSTFKLISKEGSYHAGKSGGNLILIKIDVVGSVEGRFRFLELK